MKSIVCVKRVPDTETRIRISGGETAVETTGVKYVLNPYDEFALEAALKQKEGAGEGQVTAMTVAGAEGAEALRSALAMGADDAVLLRAQAGLEGLAVAKLLAEEIRGRSYDLLLFGMKAVDDDLQAVGPMVAELLDIPAATSVIEFDTADGRITAQREIDGGVEVVELKLPCVLTLTKGSYKPRSASLKGIMAAKKKTIEDKAVEAPSAGVTVEKLSYPPERAAGRIVGQGADAVPELLRLLREEAKVL
ncbi:MAG: Electron transfer flavoprotein, beta subunit [uncultured Gemmatimonadetes bacterium]|uniref:Electron transfer flavoprotein, beta subunit n=1 Tax=uncultured Gemmatimonadota bacterium TaxID=203437 RepID=A0A6J4LAH9_9BACT|nr:MAG: Electron transfer flavoprotein, beta subunit [uncultured Gemmatimonadota bacterium]